MQNLPEVGKIYQSSTQPPIFLSVEKVHTITADDEIGLSATFIVEACEPADIDNASATGYELTGEEWIECGFLLVASVGDQTAQ